MPPGLHTFESPPTDKGAPYLSAFFAPEVGFHSPPDPELSCALEIQGSRFVESHIS